jgi:hypothetical protein
MKIAKFILSLVSVLAVFSLTACFGTPAQPTIDYQALINTSVAQTEAIGKPGTEAAQTAAPSVALPTATLQITNTPIPTFTPMATATFAPTPIPCYSMTFIKDITIPDGTTIVASTDFVKTWRLENTGSCTWTTSFQLKFISGDQMAAASFINLPKSVAPGGLVDVSIILTSPETPGKYLGNFKLRASDGTVFGAGPAGVPIFVKVVVTGPLFAVTNVNNFTVANYNANLCTDPGGHSVIFTADITTNGAGRVDTHWIFDNTGTQIIGTSNHIDFSGAGTHTVSAIWSFTTTVTTGQAFVYIDTPNHQQFGPGGSFTYTCP